IVRDLLRTQGGEWSLPQLVAQFKGTTAKNTKAIANCLEILEELGLIISNKENGKKTYYAAELTG
ncbi:MAG: hypothetical protein ACKOX2_19410, partial [Microcystaceae cyanobacterium]